MVFENFSSIESQILSSLNEGNNTFEKLLDVLQFGEKTLITTIEGLISKKILKFDNKTNTYKYDSELSGEMVVLDGNILLPTTIIKVPEKNIIYISRGEWYQFPIDFDIRRIIWNVKIDVKTNSTLVDLIKTSVLKEKKSKIVQLPDYVSLQNKIVPYSKNIGLHLHTIGEEITDISIIFKIKLDDSDVAVEHRGFRVRSEISTNELIDQLKLPIDQRDYTKIILNKIYNFSDFVYSKNEIPISLTNEGLTFVKITGIKKLFEFTYFLLKTNGETIKKQILDFDDSNEAINVLREIFMGMPSMLLTNNDFCIELSE